MDGCCGKKRAALRQREAEGIALHYLGRIRTVLWGIVTGRRYEFSPERPVNHVDPRDAAPLLESGLFRRAEMIG